MINCDNFKNMIKDFVDDKLSLNNERKFICHLDSCDKCKDLLLEEYIFYVVFNDLDDKLSLNYRDNLYNIIDKKKKKIASLDEKKINQYVIISILIILTVVIFVGIIIRIIYL